MKLKIIILAILLTSCHSPKEKPFVIIDKSDDCPDCNGWGYRYQDANGLTVYFCDDQSKYSIGDTIH